MLGMIVLLLIFTIAAAVITYIYNKKNIQILDGFCGVEPIGFKKIYENGKLKSIECDKRTKDGVCMQSSKKCVYEC